MWFGYNPKITYFLKVNGYIAEYEHRNRTLKLLLLPSFGAATLGVFVLSAIIAQKIHCIRSGSYSVSKPYTVSSD